MGKVYELGGPEIYTMHELVKPRTPPHPQNKNKAILIILFPCYLLCCPRNANYEFYIVLQAELMYDVIREWPHYVKLPFPIAKASPLSHHPYVNLCCRHFVISNPTPAESLLNEATFLYPSSICVICSFYLL